MDIATPVSKYLCRVCGKKKKKVDKKWRLADGGLYCPECYATIYEEEKTKPG